MIIITHEYDFPSHLTNHGEQYTPCQTSENALCQNSDINLLVTSTIERFTPNCGDQVR